MRDKVVSLIDISVMVPVYNTPPEYLLAALDSLRTQELGPFTAEYLVVDDASTDPGTISVLRGLERDDRFKVMWRQENGGTARALDTALGEARGEFLCAAGSDDLYKRRWVAQRAAALKKNPEYDVVYDNFCVLEDGVEAPRRLHSPHRNALLARCFIPGNSMYRADVYDRIPKGFAYEGYDEFGRRGEDYNLWLNIMDEGRALWLDLPPRTTWTYRVRPGNKSAGPETPFRKELVRRAMLRWGVSEVCIVCKKGTLGDGGLETVLDATGEAVHRACVGEGRL